MMYFGCSPFQDDSAVIHKPVADLHDNVDQTANDLQNPGSVLTEDCGSVTERTVSVNSIKSEDGRSIRVIAKH